MNRLFLALLSVGSFLFASAARGGPIRIACVGDSITAGVGATIGWDYPSQLQRMLGSKFEVRNFGVSGATLLRRGDIPYENQAAFKAALDDKPDIVIIMLGTNDTKPQNWGSHRAEFDGDYRWFAGQFQVSNPTQKLFVCRPCWIAGAGNYGINEPVLRTEIPLIDQVAVSLHLGEIDMHAALDGHAMDLPDNVHPNNAGAALMAKAAYCAITGNEFQGDVPAPSSSATGHP